MDVRAKPLQAEAEIREGEGERVDWLNEIASRVIRFLPSRIRQADMQYSLTRLYGFVQWKLTKSTR